MKTMQNKMGWLVEAAARTKGIATAMALATMLAMGTAACSSDDNIAEAPQPEVTAQAPQKVHITVGAGIGSDAQTRSTVDYNTSTKQRTLKFTAGDRLYVRATIAQEHNDNYDGGNPEDKHDSKILAGFLDIDASSISTDGKSAQFSGDLDVYVGTVTPIYNEIWDDVQGAMVPDYNDISGYNLIFTPGTHTFTTADPIAECDATGCYLVHAGSDGKYTIADDKNFDYDFYLTASANDLITSTSLVWGGYDSGTHAFNLVSLSGYAILNCTISGLTAGTQYRVRLNYGDTEDYDSYNNYIGSVTTDATGKATFAVRIISLSDTYFQLVLVSNTERKVVNLGQKTVEEKVYNVKTTATNYVFPAGHPVVYGTLAEPLSGSYWIEEAPADVTISGTFTGYFFGIENSGTVRLNNVNASCDDGSNIIFGYSSERDLTVVLTGDNYLTVTNNNAAIGCDRNLWLQCTSTSATLTIKADYSDLKGICINNNYVSNLAAPGYSVAITSTINGPDTDSDGYPDYCTWTYTVRKN